MNKPVPGTDEALGYIAVIATLDTKGTEAGFVAELIRERGHTPLIVDVGLTGRGSRHADVTRADIEAIAGQPIIVRTDRTAALETVARSAALILGGRIASGQLKGAIALGGGTGKWIADVILGSMPIGFPKVLVTTVPRGTGANDITIFPSVADLAGLNRVTVPILTNAAGAVCGMVEQPLPPRTPVGSKSIGMTMFGVTTVGGSEVRRILEEAGHEVIVFHATGAGGDAMERLISERLVDAVVDWTTTEITDLVAGGLGAASPNRLEAAGRLGLPQVVVPGAVDVINILGDVPAQYSGRAIHMHMPGVPLVRTSAEESARIGAWIGRKLSAAIGPVSVHIPRGGFSAIDIEGGPFWDPIADEAFEAAIRAHVPDRVNVHADELNINDPRFAAGVARTMLTLLTEHKEQAPRLA